MDKAFEEELKHNHLSAWFGYIRRFSLNCNFVFKHIAKGQRTVKCKQCGSKISKDVPRIFISGSWYYYTGHYCLKCASAKILEDIREKEELVSYLEENLANLRILEGVLSKTQEKECYKDLMSIGYLCYKLQPKKEY